MGDLLALGVSAFGHTRRKVLVETMERVKKIEPSYLVDREIEARVGIDR